MSAEQEKIDAILAEQSLLRQERIDAAIAGQILSSWLPIGDLRKVIFCILVLFGLLGLIKDEQWYHYVMLIFAATMSPRVMGEAAYYNGKLAGIFSK